MRLTVLNLKGGTGKTTTAVHLAVGLDRRGRTLLVDADPQASTWTWSADADSFPVTVVPWPARDLARRVAALADDFRHVVVDTPPAHESIVRQAVLAGAVLVVPLAPSTLDVTRVAPTLGLVAEVLAEYGRTADVRVLLTRVRRGTRSRREARAALDALGIRVLASEVHLRERYATAAGTVPPSDGDYDAVLTELIDTVTHG